MRERQGEGRRRDDVHPFSSRIALVLVLVVLAGGLCLAMPFWGDQALFTVYGRQLSQGAVLYQDVFDVKQPGIFWFYALGGSLFGFTELGVHLFELTYWLAFSLFTSVALRPYFTTRWGAALVPVFTVVVYYLYAGLLELTQIEILVAFPVLLAWWLIDQAEPGTRRGVRRYAAAGLAVAAVVLLKHLYVLIVVAFLVLAVLRSRRDGIPTSDIRRALGAFLVALLAPLLIVVAYFAAHGQLGRIWWAYFEMAPAAQLGGPRPVSYLVAGGRRFLIGHAPILILAVLGAVYVLRDRVRRRIHLVMGMIVWGASGAIAFLIQGWPQYKWSLFTVPVGILAAVGVEVLVTNTERLEARRWAIMAVATVGAGLAVLSFLASASARTQTRLLIGVAIGICAGFAVGVGWFIRGPRAGPWLVYVLLASLTVAVGLMAVAPLDKVRALVEHDLALTVRARQEYQWSWSDAYRAADADLEVLRNGRVLPGPLYVFGDPVLLLRAHRPQPIPIQGWGPEFLDARAWRELDSDLRSTVPSYIIVDDYVRSVIRRRYPAIIDWIESRYDVAFVGASGTWYAYPR
jgi:hypothetical protein